MIRSGMRLYSEALTAASPKERWLIRRGPLYNGELNLCRERWEFWKLRFSKVKDEVDEEASKIAQQAISVMEKS